MYESGGHRLHQETMSPNELEDRIGMALGNPKLSPPEVLYCDEPDSDEEGHDHGNPDLTQVPESPTSQASNVSGQESAVNSYTDQPRRFRTRTFRLRPSG